MPPQVALPLWPGLCRCLLHPLGMSLPPPSALPGAASASSGGAAASPGDAAAIPVPGAARAPAARRPSKGGKGGNEGDARRSFTESAFPQADAGASPDGRSPAALGSGDADESAGSDI